MVEEHNGLLRKHNYQVRQMIGLSHGSWHSRATYLVAEYCDGLLCKHNYKALKMDCHTVGVFHCLTNVWLEIVMA